MGNPLQWEIERAPDNSIENQSTFISEVYRALSVNCNFTVEQEKLLTHAYIPRALSLQTSLGFKGRSSSRSLSSAISWAILQLRHSSVLYAAYFQNSKNVPAEAHDSGTLCANIISPTLGNTNNRPGILHALLGNTKWALDFSHYVLSEIFDLADDFENVLHDSEAFTQKRKP